MWNKLLERQLKRYIKTVDVSGTEFQDLFAAISQAYSHHDEDRQLIERSLELSSRELSDANRALREAGKIIEMRNREMISSLEYARLVQNSLLAKESTIFECFEEAFIINRPRDIVGGDFFWVRQEAGRIFLCVADCTGHGVPGAFMSVISFRLLNQAVRDFQLYKPNEILTFLNEEINKAMSDQQTGLESKDALDISLIVIDQNSEEVSFSGLGQRVLHFRDGTITELRGDRAHIGQNLSTAVKPISCQQLTGKKGDVLYLFSDGIVDQFGGSDLKKFGIERLRNFLKENGNAGMKEQKFGIKTAFLTWMYVRPQIDDVLLLGVRI